MSEPLIQDRLSDAKKLADELREMADRIELNSTGEFGGAFVILPPQGADVIKTLFIDNKNDIAQFWSVLKTKAQMALDEMGSPQNQGFGRR